MSSDCLGLHAGALPFGSALWVAIWTNSSLLKEDAPFEPEGKKVQSHRHPSMYNSSGRSGEELAARAGS